MEAIKIAGLKKVYRGKRGAQVEALRGVSLSVESGTVFGFLGPNGAGKSTIIKILAGLISPSEGQASIFGVNTSQVNARRSLGYLPENPSFYDFLNAIEYLGFVGRICKMDKKQLQNRSEIVLQRLDLWEARKRPIRSYSKGMVQRLGLAQALLHDPEIYILDEPMSGLDPIGRALVKELILELRQAGRTVFFSTHITADVEKVCDYVGILNKGQIQTLSEVQDIQKGGVEGYLLSLIDQDGSAKQEFVSAPLLDERLKQIVTENMKIKLIEPRRHNLEDFFLKVINPEKHISPL